MQLLATPWTANPPSSSVHGISQARILDWVAISFFRGSSQPGIEPVSPTLAGRFFTIEPPGKPRDKIKQRCICKDVHCCDVYNSETKLDKTKTGKLSRRSKIFPSRIQGKWFLIKDFRGKRGENAYYTQTNPAVLSNVFIIQAESMYSISCGSYMNKSLFRRHS